MLGVTLAWKQRLKDETPAAPLLLILDQCAARLLQHYTAVLRDRVDAIARRAVVSGLRMCRLLSYMQQMRRTPIMQQVYDQQPEYAARPAFSGKLCEHG